MTAAITLARQYLAGLPQSPADGHEAIAHLSGVLAAIDEREGEDGPSPDAMDAVRYRWLRNSANISTACVHDPRGFRCFSYGLDETVDLAIAATKEGA